MYLCQYEGGTVRPKQTVSIRQPNPWGATNLERLVNHGALVGCQARVNYDLPYPNVRVATCHCRQVLVSPIGAVRIDHQYLVHAPIELLMTPVAQRNTQPLQEAVADDD